MIDEFEEKSRFQLGMDSCGCDARMGEGVQHMPEYFGAIETARVRRTDAVKGCESPMNDCWMTVFRRGILVKVVAENPCYCKDAKAEQEGLEGIGLGYSMVHYGYILEPEVFSNNLQGPVPQQRRRTALDVLVAVAAPAVAVGIANNHRSRVVCALESKNLPLLVDSCSDERMAEGRKDRGTMVDEIEMAKGQVGMNALVRDSLISLIVSYRQV